MNGKTRRCSLFDSPDLFQNSAFDLQNLLSRAWLEALRTKFLGLIPHLLGTETIYIELSEMLLLERHKCICINEH